MKKNINANYHSRKGNAAILLFFLPLVDTGPVVDVVTVVAADDELLLVFTLYTDSASLVSVSTVTMSRLLVLIITMSSTSGSSSFMVTRLVTGLAGSLEPIQSVSFSFAPLNIVSCLTDLRAGDTRLTRGQLVQVCP